MNDFRGRGRLAAGCLVLGPGMTGWALSGLAPDVGPVVRLFLLLAGLLMVSGGLLAWMRRDGRFLSGVLRAAAVLVLSLAAVELVSMIVVGWMQPGRLGPTARRHGLRGAADRSEPARIPVERPPRMTPFYPFYGWRVLPGSLERKIDWGRRGFRRNRPGQDDVLEPSADFRVVVVGGSSVMGWGQRPRASIPSHLERFLERRGGRDVNVINAGYPGWFSANQTALLLQEILPFYRPDLVIVLDGYNDSLRAMLAGKLLRGRSGGGRSGGRKHLYDPRLRRHRGQWNRWMADPVFVLNQWLKVSGWAAYVDPNRYFTTVLMQAGTRGVSAQVKSGEEGDEGTCRRVPLRVEPYLAGVRTSLGGSVIRGVPIIYALQPVFVFKHPKTPHERDMLRGIRRAVRTGGTFRAATLRGNWTPFGVPAGACFERVQKRFYRRAARGFERLQEHYRSSPAEVVDLSRLFSGDSRKLFGDWIHYTERGNELIARRLVGLIDRVTERTAGTASDFPDGVDP